MEKLPLSSRLIKEAHKILLKGVRGKNKLPGEFHQAKTGLAELQTMTLFLCRRITLVPDLHQQAEKVPERG